MRVFAGLLLFAAVLLSAVAVRAKAGPPIPVPTVKVTEAIELATGYFLDKEARAVDTKEFKK
jgi:hypothetical protein